MANNQLNYDINFNTDMSSLELLKEALNNIKQMSSSIYLKMNPGSTITDFQKVKATAIQVEAAVGAAFNPKLNTLNFQEFNTYLTNTGLNIQTIQNRFLSAGDSGKRAFRDLTEQLFTANSQLKESSSLVQKIGETLVNAAKWSVAYGAINKITNGIQSAWKYAISLDSALNDIRIVTGKSYEDMEKFAKSANKAAKVLGTSTMDYTKGSLIYYQQGLGERDAAARTAVSAKTANVTGQSMQEVSEELTAVWNGFKVSADEAESYVDKLAAVAAASASDLEELSTAMSRVASAASTMGIDIDQLTAQIATIESVTRQDAASIGTALKTIYSRMGDLAIGAEDEFGVALGDVSGKMKQIGIDILDQSGNMRDMGEVIEEVAHKWGTWTDAQQQAAAVALAGKRQYNNLFALFENWDMYEANKSVSENSLGELQKQQDTYMESTQAHLEQLQTTFEKLKDAFFDNKSLNNFIDAFSFLVDQVSSFVDSIGGGGTLLAGVFGTLSRVFSNTIGKNVGQTLYSLTHFKDSLNDINAEALRRLEIDYGKLNQEDEVVQKMLELEKQKLTYSDYLNENEKDRYNLLIKQTNELGRQKDMWAKTDELLKKSLSGSDTNKKGEKQNRLLDNLGAIKDGSTGFITSPSLDSLFKLSEKQRDQLQANVNTLNLEIDDRKNALKINTVDKNKSPKARQRQANSVANVAKQVQQDGFIRNTDEYKKMIDLLGQYEVAQEGSNKKEDIARELREATSRAMIKEKQVLNAIIEALNNGTVSLDVMDANLKKVAEDAEKMANEQKWRKVADSISSIVGSILQVVSAFSAITNLTDIWRDNTLDAGEQIKQTIMSLGTILLTLVPIVEKVLVAAGIKVSLAWWALTLIVLGLVVVITGLKHTFDALAEASKSAAEKANEEYQKQVEILNELQETLQNTQKAYEDLLETIDSYKGVKQSVYDLKTGTDEWGEALIKANEQALALINTYSALIDYTSVTDNGLITILNEGLELIKKQQEDALNQQRSFILAQQVEVKEKENESKKENFKEKNSIPVKYVINDYGGTSFALSYEDAKKLETTIGFESTALKNYEKSTDLVNRTTKFSSLSSDGASSQRNFLNEFRNEVLNKASEIGSSYFETEEYINDIKPLLGDLSSELEKTVRAVELNTRAANLFREQQAKQYLESTQNEDYLSSNDQTSFAAIIAKQLKLNEGAEFTGAKAANSNAYSDDEAVKEYLAKYYGVSTSAVSFSGGKVTVKTGDDKKELLYEDARDIVNQMYREEKSVEQSKEVGELVNKLSGSDYNYALGMSGGKTASFEKLTADEIAKIADWDTFKKAYTDAERKLLFGTEDAAEQKKIYENSVKQTKAENNAVNTRLSNRGITDVNQYTVQQKKALANGADALYAAAGPDSITALTTLLENSNLSAEQKAAIGNALDGIDISSATARQDFLDKMKAQGFEIKGEALDTYAGLFQVFDESNNVLATSAKNLDSIASKLKEINEITKDLKLGDIISDEDYKAIVKMNSALADYFVKTADGYMMVKGSAKELNKILKEPYKSLGQVKSFYETVRTGVGAFNEEKGNLIINPSATGANLQTQAKETQDTLNKLNNEAFNNAILKTAGLSSAQFGAAFTDVEKNGANASDESVKYVQKYQAALKDMIDGVANGLYSEGEAVQIYYTSMVDGLDEVEAAYKEGNIAEDDYFKIRSYWLNQYLDDLDITVDMFDKVKDQLKTTDKETLAFIKNLDRLKDTLDYIQSFQDGLKGEALSNNLAEQNKLIKDQIEYYQTLGKASQKSLFEQTKKLNDAGTIDIDMKKIGENMSFDQLQQLYTAYLTAYGTAEKIPAEIATAFQQAFDSLNQEEELVRQRRENMVSAATAKLEVILDETEVKKQWADFKKNYMKADDKGNLVFKSVIEMNTDASFDERFKNFQEKNSLYIKQLEEYDRAINRLNGLKSNEDSQTATRLGQEINQLRKDQMSAVEDMIDNLNELYQIWSDGWDEIAEKTENYVSLLLSINNIYQDIIDLNTKLNRTFTQINNQDLYNQQIENQQLSVEAYKKALEDARDQFNSAQNEEDKQKAQEALAEAALNYSGALSNLIDLINSKAADAFEELFNTTNLASQDWDRTKTLDERTLSLADSQLNRNKIRRQFQSAIDSADSLAAQQKLKSVMEEQLEILEKKDRLSQYEVDRANAVYELTLKQIALEESQRNASKMQLVRDTNGNLTYSFVQDQDNISKAKEELETASNNLFNIDETETKARVDKYYQYLSQAQQDLQEAQASGNEEQYQKVYDYYFGKNGLITELKKNMPEVLDNLDSSGRLAIENFSNDLLQSYNQAKEIYKSNLEEITNGVKTIHAQYTEKLTEAVDSINKSIDLISKTTTELQTSLPKFSDLKDSIDDLKKLLKDYIQPLLTSTITAIGGEKNENSLISSLSKFTTSMEDWKTAIGSYTDKISNTKITITIQQTETETKDPEPAPPKVSGGGGGGRSQLSYVRADDLNGHRNFDTGGYTGDWHSKEGKLAVLHQKELVLNEADTVNLLAAVQLTRALNETTLDYGASLAARASATTTSLNVKQPNDTIDQNVHIEASFPNATDRYEIQEAFNNLVNLATQRAFETKK